MNFDVMFSCEKSVTTEKNTENSQKIRGKLVEISLKFH